MMNKHREACRLKTVVNQVQENLSCNQCDFKTKNNINMKIHKRDNHEVPSPLISPLKKKSKQSDKTDLGELSDSLEEM